MFDYVRTLGEAAQVGLNVIAICRDLKCRYQRVIDIEKLVGRVGSRARLLPEPQQQHFTDGMRCPLCKRLGMHLWVTPKWPHPPPAPTQDPNFRVIDHGRTHPYEFTMIATADNLMVARGAFAAACHFYSDHWICLMQGAFVVHDNKQDGQPDVLQPEQYRAMRDAEKGLSFPEQVKDAG